MPLPIKFYNGVHQEIVAVFCPRFVSFIIRFECKRHERTAMARGRFLLLPSLILLLVYIRNMVAVGDEARPGLPFHGIDERDFWHGDEAIQLDVINSNHIPQDSSSSEDWATEVFSTLKSAIPVTFEPSVLDFREQPTGMPALREVKIINPHNSLTLQLTSISGELSEFHTSFFKSKVLLSGESTTFDVVFLARSLGAVEDTLHIHTSLGILDYKVKAVGVSNPFKLRPLKGARIPINATYSPVITMYNPYEVSLQIKEIYSSGGELHLELFTGQQEGNKGLWEIRPYETKSLARLNFHAPTPTNHTAFIRIKTNHTSDPSLVLPVEVEVCEAVGLFLSRELLDFGVLKGGESKSIPLYMLNAGPHLVYLKSITPVPDNPAITIEYSNTTLKPGSKYVKVAIVTYSSDVHSPDTDMILKIWAEDRTSFHQLTIPYEATILRGSLVYEKSLTLFRVHEPPFRPIIRNVTLSNQFDFPVVIFSAKLSSKALDYYSIISFDAPYVLPPDSEWHSPIRLKFVPNSSDCLFNTSLRLSTNASYFNIPLQCYDGRLEREPVVDALEFGLLSDADSGSKLLTVWNPNPVKVSITSVLVSEGSRLPDLSVHLVSLPPLPENNEPTNTLRKRIRKPPFYLDRGQSVVFRINVTRPKQPGMFAGELLIHSSLGKVLTVPVNYMAVTGAMHIIPEKIRFLPSFPFSTSTVTLSVRSTYTQPVLVMSLDIAPSSDGHHPVPITLPQEFPAIAPNALTKIGELSFDPLLLGKDFRYTSADVVMNDDEPTKGRRSLRHELDQLDALWNVWQSVIDSGVQWFNYSIVLSTEVGNGAQKYTVPVEASMEWPNIASTRTVTFPLTIIGNSSHQYLQLINPSSHPLYVEPIILKHCSQPKLVLKSLSSKFSQLDPSLFQPSVMAFSLVQESVSEYLIPPHGNVSVQLKFTPDTDQWSHGMVVLRNNLTSLEYVHLMGQSNWGYVSVSGVYPVDTGTNGRSLLFEFSPALMESCITSECGSPVYEQLSLSKIFHIYNAGSSPLTVLKSSVSGRGCEGQGFRVVNCEKPIIVYPNRTRKIEISFSPDYTLSRVTSTLKLHTSTTGILSFPLLATLPHHLLSICYNSSPYSELESMASYLSVPLWLVALTAMILATVFQVNWHARRLQRNIATRMSTNSVPSPHGRDVPVQATGGATFDLQATVQNIINERVLSSSGRDQPSSSTRLTSDSTDSQPDSTTSDQLRHRPKPVSSQPVVTPLTSDHDFISRHTSVTKPHESSEQPFLIDRQDHPFTDQRTGVVQVDSSSQTQRSSQHSRTEDTSTSLSLSPSGKPSDSSSSVSISSSVNVQTTNPAQQTRKLSKGSKRLSSSPSLPLRASPSPLKTTDKPSVLSRSPEITMSETTRETPAEEETIEEKSDQLQRKESDNSIKSSECSDAASTPSSSSSSGDSLAVPTASESHQSEPKETIEVRIKVKPLSTSYTKEPLTGQTVLVRETGEEVETVKCERDTDAASAAESSSTAVLKPRSKKKQRAQIKREEKMKRRQRDKEELSSKKLLCSQELNGGDDKASFTSSSASSTDYLEEYTNGDQEEKVCDEEKEDEEVEESSSPTQFSDQVERTSSPESRGLQDSSLAEADNDSSLVNNDHTTVASELSSAPVSKDAITCSALERDQLMTDVVDLEKDDTETQTHSDKKTNSITIPTVENVPESAEKASGLGNTEKKVKKDRVKVDTEATTLKKSKVTEKISQGRDSPLSPNKPIGRKSLQQVLSPKRAQSAPNKDLTAPAKSKTDKIKSDNSKGTALSKQEGQKVPRPQSLTLAEPNKTPSDVTEKDPPTTDGVDGTKTADVAATPHEIAASLLSKIQRGKGKNDREKPSESQQSSSQASGTTSHSKKNQGLVTDSQQQSNLSLDAQPFVPTRYVQHNPGRPGFQLRPPYRGQLLTPPYDIYPMRPGAIYPHEDPMYQERYEQRRPQRKHDHQKYQSKPGFSSPHYFQDHRERAYMLRGGGGYEPYEWSGHHDSGSGVEAFDEETAWYMRQAARDRRHAPSTRLASPPYHHSPLDPPTSRWLTPRARNLPGDSDPLWDQPAAYRDEVIAELAETRRQRHRLQKLYAEQLDAREQQLYGHHLSSPHQDVYDLSNLREQHSSLGRAHYPLDSDESTVSQLRRLREQQQHEQDDLSRLLSNSSGAVNRAPGTTRDHSKAVGSSRLLSAANSGSRLSDLLDDSDSVSSWMPSTIAEEQSSTTSKDTGWKAIWSLGSPFSSATPSFDDKPPSSTSKSASSTSPEDNNTDQASPSNAFTGNTYDLFDSAQNIWSLSSGDTGLFPWSSSSKSKNDSGTA